MEGNNYPTLEDLVLQWISDFAITIRVVITHVVIAFASSGTSE